MENKSSLFVHGEARLPARQIGSGGNNKVGQGKEGELKDKNQKNR